MQEADSGGTGCKMRSKIGLKCFTYSEKQDGLVSLNFLKLLEKVVLALTSLQQFKFSHGTT